MTIIESIDPTTGSSRGPVASETTLEELDAITARALAAAAPLRATSRAFRAELLRRMAAQLEGRREDIVSLGRLETGLTEARLNGELTRTVFQARFFADVIEEGSYLEATIDHAQDTPMGPGPDLRRLLVPLGPVAVFGASNFPLAFSVPGGDTISALAAGCPVVVKAHSSHPGLSLLTFTILQEAAEATGAPGGTLGLVFGTVAGTALVADCRIRAVAFTGSLSGGRALAEIAGNRPDPVPFFGELASLNPVVLAPSAVVARTDALVEGFVASVTGSGGQLCTKPGIVLVPHGASGDAFVEGAIEGLSATGRSILLNEGIATSFAEAARSAGTVDRYKVAIAGGGAEGPGFAATPLLVEADAAEIDPAEIDECFGPAAVLVRYDETSLFTFLDGLAGSLTATVHAEPGDGLAARVATAVLPIAGRILFDGWPTGVLVSWAQTHGGPWPSTSSQHTSVGATSIRRFLRPVTWQSAPAALLPEELRDEVLTVPRRVDGRLQLASE